MLLELQRKWNIVFATDLIFLIPSEINSKRVRFVEYLTVGSPNSDNSAFFHFLTRTQLFRSVRL